MKNITLDLKQIVKENLREKRKENIQESISRLKNHYEDKNFVGYFYMATKKLMSEGYDIEEINDQLIKEGFFDELGEKLKSKLGGSVNWGGAIGSGTLSLLKEYFWKFFLNLFGFKGQWADAISIALGDMNPLDLLRIFKNAENCTTHMPHVTKAILETVGRTITGKMTNTSNASGWGGLGTAIAGNLFGEIMGDMEVVKSVSNKACSIIHK